MVPVTVDLRALLVGLVYKQTTETKEHRCNGHQKQDLVVYWNVEWIGGCVIPMANYLHHSLFIKEIIYWRFSESIVEYWIEKKTLFSSLDFLVLLLLKRGRTSRCYILHPLSLSLLLSLHVSSENTLKETNGCTWSLINHFLLFRVFF